MGKAQRFFDGLTNVLTGLGTTADPRRARAYKSALLTEHDIDQAYRGSGSIRKVVDIPALDMVREWRDWQAENDTTEAVEAAEKRLSLQAKTYLAETYRALGGGAFILGLPGDPASPAPANATLSYIHVTSRWRLTLGPEIDDVADPFFGEPRYFTLSTNGRNQQVHPSRVITFRGDAVPSLSTTTWEEQYWGDSMVVRCIDAAQNLDNALANFGALIDRARVGKVTVPGLSDIAATAEGEAILARRLQNLATSESLFGMTLLDGGDGSDGSGEKLEYTQVTWSGIPEIIRVFAEALASVADIPMTRLWGKAAEGMSASGDSQQTDWNKMVKARQELRLRPCLERLDPYLYATANVPQSEREKLWWQFGPLDTPDQAAETTRFKTFSEAADKIAAMAVVPERAFAEAVQNTLVQEGWLVGLDTALMDVPEAERFMTAGDPADLSVSETETPDDDAQTTDAAPRTLYVSRPVLNRSDLQAWATEQGLGELQPDLHVTIACSRTPVDWMQMGSDDWNSDDDGGIAIKPGGVRIVEPLGNRTAVLLFTSSTLSWRHESMVQRGASHDYPDYQPHISLTGEPVSLDGVEPYRGEIVLGPEVFAEVDEGAV